MASTLFAIIPSPQYSHLELAQAFLQGGAKIIQLRMKEASLSKVKEIAQSILNEKKNYSFTFILNDYSSLLSNWELMESMWVRMICRLKK